MLREGLQRQARTSYNTKKQARRVGIYCELPWFLGKKKKLF